ncbi:MAG: DUF4416 domain-containing protein [Thermoplasmata archaeon]|nr:MAG: DUF4416 domain-containing protein [Thermoplasmata archaeon]
MGEITSFTPEKLIIAVLISREDFIEELNKQLEDNFGPIDYKSEILNFNYTNYYNPEMGTNIKRFFLSFQNLISPDTLSDIKILTNTIENIFREDNNRQINLDPGMLSMKSFILATTKDNGHRIPLQKGIYGEVTLLFVNKKFQSLPWTYVDYQSEDYSRVLNKIRVIYKNNIKSYNK